MNEPDRYELFTLQPHERKVTIIPDTKLKFSTTFQVQKEDHTLGNIIRMQLLRDKDVLFAGYKMPHPLDHSILVKVQTTPQSSPMKALETAIGDLISEISLVEERFKLELSRKRNLDDRYY